MKKIFSLFIILIMSLNVFSQVYEAEEADLYGAKNNNSLDGYSGSGYAQFISYDASCVAFNVDIKKDGEYAVKLRYALPSTSANVAFKIEYDEEGYLCAQRLMSSKKYKDLYANNIAYFTAGEHQIFVTGLRGEWCLDYIELVEVTDKLKNKILPQGDLVNKKASKEAKRLYDYLWSIRGKGILSGQQIYNGNTEDIKAIEAATGKTPAVLGIDLIDFSPSRVQRGANAGRVLSVAKNHWKAGGIVTCCWHWNAPMGLLDLDQPEKHWYDGFRSGATTFNFVKGLNDTDSEEYKLIIRDIDAIAKQLKYLKDSNVPVLWRPLHEASGGWFWWGARGADAYIKLYQLLFDRLVNHHQLDNLIWVWNGQDPYWYPGDEYVDIISYDYYPSRYRHGNANEYLELIQSASAYPKICAISENGSLPNIVKLEKEKSLWTWFCTWNGNFAVKNKKYSEEYTKLSTLQLYYNNPYCITRDEVPDLIN